MNKCAVVDHLTLVAHQENFAWGVTYKGLLLDAPSGKYVVYQVRSRKVPKQPPTSFAEVLESPDLTTEQGTLEPTNHVKLAHLLRGGVCQGRASDTRRMDAGNLTVSAVWPEGHLVIGQFGDMDLQPRDEGQVKLFEFMANFLRARDNLPPTKYFADPEAETADVAEKEWVPVWIPKLKSAKTDDPTAEKIGGLPGLLPGTKWPRLKGKPALFVMQFRDPRPGRKQRFVQLFVQQEDELEAGGESVVLREIQQPDLLEAPQRVQPGTMYDDKAGVRLITGWTKGKETSEHHISDMRCPKPEEAGYDCIYEVADQVRDIMPEPYGREKVGGVGDTCQAYDYTLFIQNLFPQSWGDGGSLHVSDEGQLFGDMC